MAGNIDPFGTYLNNGFGTTYRLTMSTLYSAVALVTTVLNSLILISIWKTPSLHKPSYILIASLALSDLLVGAVGEPLMVILQSVRWSPNNSCVVFRCAKSVCYTLGAISLLTLTFISLDRLLAVKLRNRYQSIVTQKRVLLVLLTWWILLCIICATLVRHVSYDSTNFTALLLFAGIVVLTSVGTIIVCYSMAFHNLRKITSSSVSPSVQNAEAVAHPSSNIDVAKYRKSLITMFIVFICTILFYTPFVVNLITAAVMIYINAMSKFSTAISIYFVVFNATELVSLLNSVMNPLLYLWRMRDIREAVKTTVKRVFKVL